MEIMPEGAAVEIARVEWSKPSQNGAASAPIPEQRGSERLHSDAKNGPNSKGHGASSYAGSRTESVQAI
jgi:hypothetical protein